MVFPWAGEVILAYWRRHIGAHRGWGEGDSQVRDTTSPVHGWAEMPRVNQDMGTRPQGKRVARHMREIGLPGGLKWGRGKGVAYFWREAR